jgi:hypothetical protein
MDARIVKMIADQRKNDKSFTDKAFFGFPIKYKQSEVREIWFQAMEVGMEKGLIAGSLEGQRIDTTTNCKNERHKEFYTKFLELAHQYKCAIQYHPLEGMCVIDRSYDGS